jgi:hypothetical protein
LLYSQAEEMPVSNQTADANSRDQQSEDPISKNQNESEEQNTGKGHPPLKGTDTPAHTDLAYAEREKGKRTTM